MVFLQTFCFYFTIRLGALLVGILSSVESVISIGLLCWCDKDCVRSNIRYVLDHYEVSYMNTFYLILQDHAGYFNWILISFASLHTILSTLLIYASYKCIKRFIIIWLISDLVRIFIFLSATALILLTIKENDSDLGQLIPATLLLSFMLMFLVYCWTCPLSLYQALSERNKITPSMSVRQLIPTVTSSTERTELTPYYHHYYTGLQVYS